MSRRDKQYARYDELEARFHALLGDEIEKVSGGQASSYLGNQPRYDRFSSEKKPLEIEQVEKELDSLREQLGEPRDGSWLSVADELLGRTYAIDGAHRFFMPKAAAAVILSALRGKGGVADCKAAIQSCLTERVGSTAYSFSKEALTKGLAYPIKRQALDAVIRASGIEELDGVLYSRQPSYSKPSRQPAGLRPGELLLSTYFSTAYGRRPQTYLAIHLYSVPSSEAAALKPHIEKTVLPALRDWLSFVKSADVEWRSQIHSLDIGWYLGELVIFKK